MVGIPHKNLTDVSQIKEGGQTGHDPVIEVVEELIITRANETDQEVAVIGLAVETEGMGQLLISEDKNLVAMDSLLGKR